ncbi:MAG TPA: hypothetical protein DCL41_10965 [Bdellovibrionales bacterium]|nr:hypothetical protein [Pseudobdellovibrionaceae bacterium]HAG92387.1 hypothetical protein [Bdellovibrionales bacterium]|tara:strand:- start:1207 stop:1893 length:687 start_codon:yes stop_codon:yes gene_type:complete
MQKLLLEFNNLEDMRVVKKDFERELPFEVIPALNPRETNRALSNKSIQLIVMQSKQFRQPEMDRVHELRKLGYSYPLLIIQDHMTPLAERMAEEDSKIVFLDKPFELRTLRGITRKLLTSRSLSKQQFKRYHTNQKVAIETFISGENVDTKMFNLSKGGAYFEVSKKPGLGVGELLRLRFQLDQVEKEHHIHGRIVWTTPKGHSAGGFGIGVKFIKTEDIYRHLLQNV